MAEVYGIVNKAVAEIYRLPAEEVRENGRTESAIADEGLCGMGIAVTGKAEKGFLPVRTHYGYCGHMKPEDLNLVSLKELQDWENSDLMVTDGFCADVMSAPEVTGVRLISLYRGALVALEGEAQGSGGWERVRLAGGREGYMKRKYLSDKRYSQAGLWNGGLPQTWPGDEAEFREAVVRTAFKYLGVQYRWGGKSTAGIDCSGLTSMSYMHNGIFIYRDAGIQEKFPVYEIPLDRVKKGDLLYFPGHIALYIGEGRYIHSTGSVPDSGVVVNSLNPHHGDYRADLAGKLCTAGSIF